MNDIERAKAMLAGDTLLLRVGSEKAVREFRRITETEVRAVKQGDTLCYGSVYKMYRVRVTSVKTWKTRPDVEIRCKHGLREYFALDMAGALRHLVVEL